MRIELWLVVAALVVAGCGGDDSPPPGGDDAGGGVDSGGSMDSGGGVDSGGTTDSGGADASPGDDGGLPIDATMADATTGTDAGTSDAGGPPVDAGPCGTVDKDSPLVCFKQCSVPSDCTLVQTGNCCCACNMGGQEEAINSAYTSEWAQRRAEMCSAVDCTGLFCPAVYLCSDAPPGCVAGQCQIGPGVTM